MPLDLSIIIYLAVGALFYAVLDHAMRKATPPSGVVSFATTTMALLWPLTLVALIVLFVCKPVLRRLIGFIEHRAEQFGVTPPGAVDDQQRDQNDTHSPH